MLLARTPRNGRSSPPDLEELLLQENLRHDLRPRALDTRLKVTNTLVSNYSNYMITSSSKPSCLGGPIDLLTGMLKLRVPCVVPRE